jgi:hypothetical protein
MSDLRYILSEQQPLQPIVFILTFASTSLADGGSNVAHLYYFAQGRVAASRLLLCCRRCIRLTENLNADYLTECKKFT